MHMKKLIFGVALAVGFAIFFGFMPTAGAISYPQAYTLSPWDAKLTGNNNPELFPDGIFNGPLRVIPHPTVANKAVAISGNLPNPTACIDDPNTPNTIDAAADGVFKTEDKGNTWTRIGCPPPYQPGIEEYPNVLDADMAIVGGYMVLLLGTWKDGVFLYKEETGSCENISDGGVIIEPGAWNQPGHCSAYQHINHTFDNQCDDNIVCGELPNCGTNIKPHRWAVTGVKIADIDTYYIGIADTAVNISAPTGTGDHPGFYKTTNGGTSWTRIIGDVGSGGVYDYCDLSDPFACQIPVTPHSQTCAPSSIDIDPLNTILAGMGEIAASTVPSLPQYDPCTQARVLKSNNQGASWSDISQGLEGTQTCTHPVNPAVSVLLTNLSTTIASVSPSGTKVALGHLAVSAEIYVGIPENLYLYYQSRGVYERPIPGYTWSEQNNGFPICQTQPCEPEDPLGEYWGIMVGPISFKPTDENFMSTGIIFCGVSNGINSSGPYIFSPTLGEWINFTQFSYGINQSPNQACVDEYGNPMFCQDSSASMAVWSNDGLGIYSPISWTDELTSYQPGDCNIFEQEAPQFTGDDGIYFMDMLLRGYINYE